MLVGWPGAAVTHAEVLTLRWAVDVIRRFFGENWLADNADRTGHVPLLNHQWWPLNNPRALARVLELAARITLVAAQETCRELDLEAQTIYAK